MFVSSSNEKLNLFVPSGNEKLNFVNSNSMMNIFNTHTTRMYYVPTVYYWVDNDNIFDNVKIELTKQYIESKSSFYKNIRRNKDKFVEKTPDYVEYKSNLIRLTLLDYAHSSPNGKGKDLLENIIKKWIENPRLKQKTKELIYHRSIKNITKYEKTINNIEEIMMLINLQILENYYE